MNKVLELFNLHYSIGLTNHTPGDPFDVAYVAMMLRTMQNSCCTSGCNVEINRVWTTVIPDHHSPDDWVVS